MYKKTLLLLIGLISLRALLLFYLQIAYQLPLAPDEAQYWTWSQQLDLGYYSKPPGIAWQIFLGTKIFGNTELGVRFFSIVLGSLISFVIYRSAFLCGLKPWGCFWAAIAFAISPAGFYLSMAATTDVGAICFFMIALAAILEGIANKKINYLKIGIYIAIGALFKWTSFYIWIFIIFGLLFQKELRSKKIVFGILISLLGLLPSLIWNVSHDWATFQHVGGNLAHTNQGSQGNFFDFLAAQAGLFSPVFFVALLIGWCWATINYKKQTSAFLFCSLISATLLLFLATALFKKLQANWAIFLVPSGFIVIAHFLVERPKKWLAAGVPISIGLISIGLLIPWMQAHTTGLNLPYKINPFQQNLGWQRLAGILESQHFNPEKDFLVADKYQMTSILSFYNTQKIRAYFLNISQSRKNQFSYWEGLEQQAGKTGYFFISENRMPTDQTINWYEQHYQKQLNGYFESVQCAGTYPLFENQGEPVKFAMLFICENYSGQKPIDPEVY